MFYDDKERPNRYLLAKEMISRPNSEDLEVSCFKNHYLYVKNYTGFIQSRHHFYYNPFRTIIKSEEVLMFCVVFKLSSGGINGFYELQIHHFGTYADHIWRSGRETGEGYIFV